MAHSAASDALRSPHTRIEPALPNDADRPFRSTPFQPEPNIAAAVAGQAHSAAASGLNNHLSIYMSAPIPALTSERNAAEEPKFEALPGIRSPPFGGYAPGREALPSISLEVYGFKVGSQPYQSSLMGPTITHGYPMLPGNAVTSPIPQPGINQFVKGQDYPRIKSPNQIEKTSSSIPELDQPAAENEGHALDWIRPIPKPEGVECPQLPSIKSLLSMINGEPPIHHQFQSAQYIPSTGYGHNIIGSQTMYHGTYHPPSFAIMQPPIWNRPEYPMGYQVPFSSGVAPTFAVPGQMGPIMYRNISTNDDGLIGRATSPLSSESLHDAVAESLYGTKSGSLQTKRSDLSTTLPVHSSGSSAIMGSDGNSSEKLSSGVDVAHRTGLVHRHPHARDTIEQDDCLTDTFVFQEPERQPITNTRPTFIPTQPEYHQGPGRKSKRKAENITLKEYGVSHHVGSANMPQVAAVEERAYRVNIDSGILRGLRPSLTIAVLFDGAGYARLGLEQAGHHCIGFEIDPVAHYMSSFIGSRNTHLYDIWNIYSFDQFHAIWISPPIEQAESSLVRAGYNTHKGNILGWALQIFTRYRDKVVWIETGSVPGSGSNQWGDIYNAGQFIQNLIPGPQGVGQNRNRVVSGRYPPPRVWRKYSKTYPSICPHITTTENKSPMPDGTRAARFYGHKLRLSDCARRMGMDYVPEQWLVPMASFKGTLADWEHEVYRVVGSGLPVYMARAFGEACNHITRNPQ